MDRAVGHVVLLTVLAVATLDGGSPLTRLGHAAVATAVMLSGVLLARRAKDPRETLAISWLVLGLVASPITGIAPILAAAVLPLLSRRSARG